MNPGLYVARNLEKRARLMAAQPKTLDNAMDRWDGGPETVFVDDNLFDDEWYIVVDGDDKRVMKAYLEMRLAGRHTGYLTD